MEEYLEQLNDSQREAVLYNDGPSLVIAGAGSGKTRVLTYKIAHLLNLGLDPHTILALTFTNKAAREMKERIAGITGEKVARRIWMGTFHSIFSRILRYESERIGYPSDFTIYDASDSKSLIRSIIKEMGLDEKSYKPGMIQSRISNAKNALVTCGMYMRNADLLKYDADCKVPRLGDIYEHYQSRCVQAGAMDFDDLLLQTNILLRDNPDVLDKYRQMFRFVLVDEYQDTNQAQHMIVKRLCETHKRLCVVGDDAQSIYSFRGANIDNILRFREQYKGCRIFKLERNYRSTRNIVNAANSLIGKNREQIQKTVYSEKEEGERLRVIASYSDYEEGYAVVTSILEMIARKKYGYQDFALLYRTNAQSRIIEEALRKRGVPYKIYGGLSFYQRKEIKDIISYFRLVINPRDEEAFKRVINYPARGIGDTTVGKIATVAIERGISFWEVLGDTEEYGLPVNKGTAKKLEDFRSLIEGLIVQNETLQAEEMALAIVRNTGLMNDLYQDRSVEGISRQENMEELMKGIAEFTQFRKEEGEDGHVSLADFLSEVSLLTDQDNDKEENADKVTLMTVHAAKGLEFNNVFVVGLEENLFPSSISKDNPKSVEEERRLFYVAITRAKEHCLLSYAKSRFRNGKSDTCTPSRFLADIDKAYLDMPADGYLFDPLSERKRFDPASFSSPLRQPREEEYTSPVKQAAARLSKLSEVEKQPVTSDMRQATDPHGLTVGNKVCHQKFGEGMVMAIEENGDNTKAIIEFLHFGSKQLLLKYAKLKVLS